MLSAFWTKSMDYPTGTKHFISTHKKASCYQAALSLFNFRLERSRPQLQALGIEPPICFGQCVAAAVAVNYLVCTGQSLGQPSKS